MTSIQRKILLVVLLPLMGLVGVSAVHISRSAAVVEELEKLIPEVNVALEASRVSHELQIERGLSAAMLGAARGSGFEERLGEQRRVVDAEIERFGEQTAGEDWSNVSVAVAMDLEVIAEDLAGLRGFRARVDAREVDPAEAVASYTHVIEDMIKLINDIQVAATEHQTAEDLLALKELVLGKERAGIERAIGTNLFALGRFDPLLYRAFVTQAAQEEAYFEEFVGVAPPEIVRLFEAREQTPEAKDVAALRQVLLDLPLTNSTNGVAPREWFSKATARIDTLKETKEALGTLTLQHAEAARMRSLRAEWIEIAITVVMFIASLTASTYFARQLAGGIRTLKTVVGHVASESDDADLSKLPRTRCELGELSTSVEALHKSAREARAYRAHQEERRQQAEEEKRAMMCKLAEDLRHSVGDTVQEVGDAAKGLERAAQSLSESASQGASQATEVAAAANQATTNVGTVASAADELSASIEEINKQVTRSSEMAGNARIQANTTRSAMEGLSQASQRIGTVVSTIQDVAEQTNLLALNATIEAARAGEAGKGFAVVANEVKGLASQTGKATQEISSQIADVQQATEDAARSIGAIVTLIEELSEASGAVAAAVHQQSAATSEIARGAVEANDGTAAVSGVAVGLTKTAETTGEQAERVLAASVDLTKNSSRVREKIDAFIETIVAA